MQRLDIEFQPIFESALKTDCVEFLMTIGLR